MAHASRTRTEAPVRTMAALVVAACLGAMPFVAAGRLTVPAFWAYLGLVLMGFGGTTAALSHWAPALLAERMHPVSDRDPATRRLVVLPVAAHLVLAGFDARLGWSAMPLALQAAGFAAVGLGFCLVAWTLLSNPFASSAVRLQADRGQRVIEAGPYRWVRHPMYLAVLLVCSGGGVALGSWWSAVALLPVAGLFIRRTALEDGLLRAGLPGYEAYAGRVRWRLVPGLY